MNPTIGNSKLSTWKRIKAHYIVVGFGLALSASALFAIATLHQGSAKPTPGAGSSDASAAHAVQTPSFVYYLVGSQQESALFDAVLSSESGTFGSGGIQTITLVVDTPEAESLVAEASRELMQAGANYMVVDLRTPSPSPTALNSNERSVSQPSSQLDADIMAGVISTERATWDFSALSPAPIFGAAGGADFAAQSLID